MLPFLVSQKRWGQIRTSGDVFIFGEGLEPGFGRGGAFDYAHDLGEDGGCIGGSGETEFGAVGGFEDGEVDQVSGGLWVRFGIEVLAVGESIEANIPM